MAQTLNSPEQATNNPSHANASAAVPTHFNLPDHSIVNGLNPGVSVVRIV